MVKYFVICVSRRLNFFSYCSSVSNIGGGEHYLKEELEATWPHQSFCEWHYRTNHYRKI